MIMSNNVNFHMHSCYSDDGGEAILAHPGINLNGNYDMLDELIELGLDGFFLITFPIGIEPILAP